MGLSRMEIQDTPPVAPRPSNLDGCDNDPIIVLTLQEQMDARQAAIERVAIASTPAEGRISHYHEIL
jgi:hypothetical protein